MHMLQYVQKIIKKSSDFFADSTKIYILGLILTTCKKNCSAMALSLGVSKHSFYDYFKDFEHEKKRIQDFAIIMINLFATEENPGFLISDTTQILKLYGNKIKTLCYDRNGSIKLVAKGMSCVAFAWANGKVIIPLDFDFWIRKKDIKDNREYRKKTEITEELLLEWKEQIPFKYVILDGDYGNEPFLRFLHEIGLLYFIRMPKSRIVITDGKELSLAEHPFFKLNRNERYKTARCTYKGIPAYVTSQKRKGPKGTKQVVFVISNVEGLAPKQYIDIYDLRWPVEMMFRTLKQYFGLQECQCQSEGAQEAHVFANFLAFTIIEIQKYIKKKKSLEQVLKLLRPQETVKTNPEWHPWVNISI